MQAGIGHRMHIVHFGVSEDVEYHQTVIQGVSPVICSEVDDFQQQNVRPWKLHGYSPKFPYIPVYRSILVSAKKEV
jgi:uncharacterized membrane protein